MVGPESISDQTTLQQAAKVLQAADQEQDITLIPISTGSSGALDPDHYLPGFRTVFPLQIPDNQGGGS